MHAALRTAFLTTDPDEAQARVTAAYAGGRVSVEGATDGFRCEGRRTDLGGLHLDAFSVSVPTSFDLAPMARLVVGRVLEGDVEVTTEGAVRRLAPGDVYVPARPDQRHRAVHAAHLDAVGVDMALIDQVDPDRGAARARQLTLEPLAARTAQHWNRTVAFAHDVTRPGAVAADNPLVLGGIGRLVAGTLLAAFAPDLDALVASDSQDARPASVRRAVAHIEANPDLDLSVADLARASYVSVRALQLAFRRHLGTTPLAYLRRVRLDRVHADLVAADPSSGTTVLEVAGRWGFVSAGRFSAQYRAAYDELPRQTLQRR